MPNEHAMSAFFARIFGQNNRFEVAAKYVSVGGLTRQKLLPPSQNRLLEALIASPHRLYYVNQSADDSWDVVPLEQSEYPAVLSQIHEN